MILIVCASSSEASFLREAFMLKKDTEAAPWELFLSQDIFEKQEKSTTKPKLRSLKNLNAVGLSLIQTGEGALAASMGTTFALCYLQTRYNLPIQGVLHVGTAYSSSTPPFKAFIAKRLTESFTERNFYPDLLMPISLPQETLVTLASKHCATHNPPPQGVFFDFEASAIYQAANMYLPPHALQFFKILLESQDFGVAQKTNAMRELIEQHMPYIRDLIHTLKTLTHAQEQTQTAADKLAKVEEFLEKLEQFWHITESMRHEAKSVLLAYLIFFDDFCKLEEDLLTQKPHSAAESKKLFSDFIAKLKNKIQQKVLSL